MRRMAMMQSRVNDNKVKRAILVSESFRVLTVFVIGVKTRDLEITKADFPHHFFVQRAAANH